MSLFKLVRRNMLKHKLRLLLTGAAAVSAMFLMVFLRSMLTTLDDAVEDVASNRLVTQSAVSLFINLPESYTARIGRVEGVESVSRWQWFGGIYRDQSNFFAQFAVDPELFLEQYPECVISEEERRGFLADRRACLIGQKLAERFGFEVGDTVPLLGTIFAKPTAWEFTVAGIYESERANLDESTMWFHYDYLRETLERGDAEGPPGVGVFVVKMKPGYDAADLAERIDAVFSGGPQRTRTQTEAAFSAGFITMLGNVPTFMGWIGGAVLFALVLTLINTMLISSAERMQDIGVLKALGFSNGTCAGLLLGEAMALALGGATAGVALAYLSVPAMKDFLTELPGINLSGYAIRPETGVAALAVAVAAGLMSGLLPAIRASRLEVADALREEI